MFCNQCGEKGDGRFCENCGAPLCQPSAAERAVGDLRPPEDWVCHARAPEIAPPALEPPETSAAPDAAAPPAYAPVPSAEPPQVPRAPSPYGNPPAYAEPVPHPYYQTPGAYQVSPQQKKKSKALIAIVIVAIVVVVALIGLLIVLLAKSTSITDLFFGKPAVTNQDPGENQRDEKPGSETEGFDPMPGSDSDPGSFMYPMDDNPIRGETEAWSGVLTPGHYTAGVDIPVGYYRFYCVAGFGNVWTNNYNEASWINEILGYQIEGYSDSYSEEIFLSKGTVLTLLGPTIRIESDEADVKNLAPRKTDLTQSFTFTPGRYTVGKDLPAGVYNFECISGYVYLYGNRSDDSFSIDTDLVDVVESVYDEHSFSNVILSAGTVLEISGEGTVVLTPSQGSVPKN